MITHTPTKQFLHRLTALAALIAIVFVLTISGCDDNSSPSDSPAAPSQNNVDSPAQTSATTPIEPSTAGASESQPAGATNQTFTGPPSISFERFSHEFGQISETDTVTTTFEFTNTGGGTLTISEVRPDCTCTTVSLSKRSLQPGESGEVSVRFAPTATGQQKKRIHIASNDVSKPKVTLAIEADVEAFITLDPAHVKFGTVLPGHSRSAYVTVLSPDPTMRVRQVTATDPSVKVRVVQASSEEATAPIVGLPGQALIEVTVSEETPWGPLFSWVAVQVEGTPPNQDQRLLHTRQFRVEASVFGELVAEPDAFRAGARPGESFTRTLRLKRISGEPFRLVQYTIREMTTATLASAILQATRISDSEYELVLRGTAGQEIGNFTAVVNIITDVPGEENIQIDIAGRVIGPTG